MGSGKKMRIPIQVKPQAAKQTVNPLETVRTPRNRFQFVVEPFDKSATGPLVKIVGNFVQVMAKGLEKLIKTGELTTLNFINPLRQTTPPFGQAKLPVENSSQFFAQGISQVQGRCVLEKNS